MKFKAQAPSARLARNAAVFAARQAEHLRRPVSSRLTLALICVNLLVGCGQRGPLTLPKPIAKQASPPAAAPSAPQPSPNPLQRSPAI